MTLNRPGQRLRCAIYTRKSTEEGLEQEFNSLHAQREACEAYIASQRHQGWILDPAAYDDGGFSGGSMERPALKRLTTDIEAGRIDIIVVYKVDRLTRALSDFAKLVDLFDRKQVSFVSVTQQFNTTTSMGRLTLNVLLSFAQFEREVIGERIRDKIAASKRRGLWMGGQPPLGYDVRDRHLVVNEAEAQTVVAIFRRYLELQSVHALRDELATTGVRSRPRRRADGAPYGDRLLGRGGLYAMLQSRIYRGDITHKGSAYTGQHKAIIDQALWDQVQPLLTRTRAEHASGIHAKAPALLAGMLFDADGARLTPTHAIKRGTRYRYYVSAALVRGTANGAQGWRIPAADLDKIVVQTVCSMLVDPVLLLDTQAPQSNNASSGRALIEAGRKLGHLLTAEPLHAARAHLTTLACRITLHPGRIEIQLSTRRLFQLFGAVPIADDEPDPPILRSVPATLKRAGREMRMTAGDLPEPTTADPSLLRLLARAHDLHDHLATDPELSIAQLATEQKLSTTYVYRLLRLRWLAPDIVTAILEGRQPATLNATAIMHQKSMLPAAWTDQRRHLAFT